MDFVSLLEYLKQALALALQNIQNNTTNIFKMIHESFFAKTCHRNCRT